MKKLKLKCRKCKGEAPPHFECECVPVEDAMGHADLVRRIEELEDALCNIKKLLPGYKYEWLVKVHQLIFLAER
jgi:hypothetical protein